MKISRRNFLGKAMKSLALVVVAPMVAIPKPSPPQPGLPRGNAKDKGEVIKVRRYTFECTDYVQQIKILDYKPGMTIPYESLDKERSCINCMYAHACTETGKRFIKHNPAQHKPFVPEIWSKELMARFYKSTAFDKFI